MKWLVVYEGVVTGSMGGRDDGYPETKLRVFENDEQLARFRGYGEFYKLTPANNEADKVIEQINNRQELEKLLKANKKANALKKLTAEERELLEI